MRVSVKALSILLSLVLAVGALTVIPVSASTYAEYIDKSWDATQQKVVDTTVTITDYTALNKDMTSLGSGIYVVDSNITYSKRLEIKDNSNVGIVLCNGYTLENNKGIRVPQSSTLTFYGQDGNTGTVNVYNADGAGIGALDEKKTGHLIFKGGHIIAKGGNKDAGIGTGKNDSSGYEEISIYGGTVEATGGDMGAGIGAGRSVNNKNTSKVINIYGGTVIAKGGDYGAGIGGGEDSDVALINIYGGEVTATGGQEGAGIGSGNDEDNQGTINIYGGTVNATGGKLGAGIGSGDNGNSGWINIYGGDITAHGGENAAGIGSGEGCNVDTITISGGKVSARGTDGAGIGAAEDGKHGTIIISGGDIRAMSKRGAGIGGGYDENTSGTITISGGEVFAASSSGAGIGAGMASDLDSPIYIQGGIVHARSSVVYDDNEFMRLVKVIANEVPLLNILGKTHEPGAAIGCGARGSQHGTIYIQGGAVFAYGGGFGVGSESYFGGAGIGAGMEQIDFSDSDSIPGIMWDAIFDNQTGTGGEGGPVEITGGLVLAAGGYHSSAIGYGYNGDELKSLKLPDNYTVYSVDTEALQISSLVEVVQAFSSVSDLPEALAAYEELKAEGYITHAATDKRVKECQTEDNVVLILPCWHLNRTYDVTEETHSLHCLNCKYEELNQPHLYNENLCECALYNGAINQFTTITFTDLISDRAYPTFIDAEYTLPAGRDCDPDENGTVRIFTAWKHDGSSYQPGEKVTVTKNMVFDAEYEDQYLIKIDEGITNGRLTADYDRAREGTTITVTPHPDRGYRLKNIRYIRKDHGTGTNELDHVEGSPDFTVVMPPSQLTFYAEFEKINYENHAHTDGTLFLPCTDPSVLSGAGSYYLIEDTELTASSLSSGELNICLMGHTLTVTDENYTVAQGAALSIYDESGKGVVTGKTIHVNGTLSLHAGDLKYFTNGAVFVGSGGAFNLYGGTVADNISENHGAGVYVASGGSLNLCGDVTVHMNRVVGDQDAETDENVYLETGALIHVLSELSEDTVIGVTVADTENLPVTVTSALNGKAAARNFMSDSDAFFTEYNSADDTVALSRPFVLSFDANGGTGEMAPDVIKDEQYFLPGCDFTPPQSMTFAGWSINDTTYQSGDPYVATSNQSATAYAIWDTLYGITVNGSENGTVTASAQTATAGEVITLDVAPADHFAIDSVSVDETEITPQDGVYSFVMPEHDVTVSAAFIRVKYFVYHSISLNGDIGINYYVDLSEEEFESGAEVSFSWVVNGVENKHAVTLTKENKTDYGYKSSVPVAVAEMTYDVTATLAVGGVQVDTDTYSVKRYGDAVLTDAFREDYLKTHTTTRYEKLCDLIKTMLDYGAKAQLEFNRNIRKPANKGLDYVMEDVTDDMITTSPSDMGSGLDAFGLEYKGSTIVYLTKTSLRHYYRINHQQAFDAVSDSVTFDGERVEFAEKDGLIYFEKKNIAAPDLDKPYTLTIGDTDYNYCVLDYVRECLNAEDVPPATYLLVSATYWYNRAANAYFD